MGTNSFCAVHDIRHNVHRLIAKLSDSLKDEPEVRFLRGISCPATMDIVHLIYRPAKVQGSWKDIEFSRATVDERRAQGMSDARFNIEAAPWLAPFPPELGVRTFDLLKNRYIS